MEMSVVNGGEAAEYRVSEPAISVAMSVYNGAPYLGIAIESILAQSFADFEFLILNDGSTDDSAAIIDRYAAQDSRIRGIHRENKGLIVSLNQLLDEARAPIIARMDGDDIALPERFAKQHAFLTDNPDHGVVSSWTTDIDRDGTPFPLGGDDQPTSHEAFLAAIRAERVTHVMMVPSQIAALLDAPGCTREALASIEALCSVGAPLPVEHKARLRHVAPGALYELYGLTEGFVTILDRTDFDRKMGSVGTPTYFNEMRIVADDGRELAPGEVGEIVGRGPLMMPGYHGRPDLTSQAIVNGWLYTGDLGYADEDGFLFLVDRKKDLIISGGVNVYPKDIEEVLTTHPAVREAAVFGIPHDKWGEAPVGAVISDCARSARLLAESPLPESARVISSL